MGKTRATLLATLPADFRVLASFAEVYADFYLYIKKIRMIELLLAYSFYYFLGQPFLYENIKNKHERRCRKQCHF